MHQHFEGREALAKKFASAFIVQWQTFDGVGLDDASQRRYFRVVDEIGQSYIVMDAPPEIENASQFVHVAEIFAQQHIKVPEILAFDKIHGFVLMQDFGDEWFYHELNVDTDRAMGKALALLQDFQQQTNPIKSVFPPYERDKMLREMALFQQWFLPFVTQFASTSTLNQTLALEQQQLVTSILRQPNVCVHRDFHSRNLMSLDDGRIGIIDFQDALLGPASYDLISLTRDCYIRYEAEKIQAWEEQFRAVMFDNIDAQQWRLFCTQTALQRHLKVLGLFVKLAIDAGKVRYLNDLPLVLAYALQEAQLLKQHDHQMDETLECLEQAQSCLVKRIQEV